MDIADLSALLGEDLAAGAQADLWVVLGPAPASGLPEAPLLGEARRLADTLGCYVHAVLADESQTQQAIAFGADRVHVASASNVANYLAGQSPEFVLLPAAQNALAAQLAQHLQAGLVTDVAGPLAIDPGTRALRGLHPVYGGEYYLDVAVTSPVKIATVQLHGWPMPYADSSRSGAVAASEVTPDETSATVVRDLGPAEYTPPLWRPLSKARVIVSAGRGVGDTEGFALARQLADRLGAELAGDRSARDSGWIDEAHEVGVTGQEVAPEIYVAVGILGDTIHNAAIAGARKVVAIHANPAAPIFKAADIGVVADPKEILPRLLEALA